MNLIEIKGLSVFYGNFCALEDVDLQVRDDDFLGVIGPNGGGKTTLIKAIIGALPYRGSINYTEGIRRNGNPSIGYLPQQERFDTAFPISVTEVILSGLQAEKHFTRRYRRQEREHAMQLAAMTGIGDVAGRCISEISGGQLQRALLCRAIISEPKLLILDEPANFVDNRFEKELYEILHNLNKRMAIIMVSHDLGTISSVVKNIICVNRHVHRHNSNRITAEQLHNYDCPIQLVYHGEVPHTVLEKH